jgi:hypothetical protein
MGGDCHSFCITYPEITGEILETHRLEDWKLKVPYQNRLVTNELKQSYAGIKQLDSYYDGKWKPEYDQWSICWLVDFKFDFKK